MLRFCGGWKSWTSEQALDEDLNYIAEAREGAYEMLTAIFGKPKTPEPSAAEHSAPVQPPGSYPQNPNKLPVLTPDAFDKMFGDPKGSG